mmetsp:Transcript_39996/g.98971  ORF Transcript_39996/g.98971 Transcript_39996/m.98971 type:complete len:202 (+) Transcript_39996:444-1049(+)
MCVSHCCKACRNTPMGCRPQMVFSYFLRYSVNASGSLLSMILMPTRSSSSMALCTAPCCFSHGVYLKRLPQWQKSEEITNKFAGSSRYFASSAPYTASACGVSAPTRMGTSGGSAAPRCWNALTMYGRCISRLCSFSSTSMSIPMNSPVACSSAYTAWSMVRSPMGVRYVAQRLSAHLRRNTWCDGPNRNTRLMPSGFMFL